MENSLSPLLPAFNLLWRAALKENSERTVNANKGDSNCTVSKQQPYSPAVKASAPKMQNQITCISSNDESNSNTTNDETVVESVVVCTLECDHGAKFIRQIIHEGTQRSEWSRAEDLFVDWLNCELMSKQAQRIDATMYFSHIPINTCSYGLCLWLQNLREVGKEVNVKIKIASLGMLGPRYVDGDSNGTHEHQEAQETVAALRKLAQMGVVVELLSAGDWRKLISLLTDHASLEVLDLQQTKTPSAEWLYKSLQSTM